MTAKYAMPRIGDVIADKYRLEKVAGEGGMGIVYAAEHLVLKQRVAVKVLLPDAASSEAMVERFAREARAAARINSEHVARVLDAGSLTSGAPFLVMEYLEGCDLEELLELQRALPVPEVVDYLVQALEGLAHAHASGIVHRDLKPANLFLGCRPDGSNAIKLLDFGISKATKASAEDKRLTGAHVLGSPVYMSPEQLRNSNEIDCRADIWSIGIVGYELLVGVPPFDGDGVGEIFAGILEKEPIPLHEKNAKIPEKLSNILGKCLRRDEDERWGDAAILAKELAPFGTDPRALNAIVERCEQVLARAKAMKVQSTPIETRRVVEAIDAAAKNALTTGTKSFPAIPLEQSRLKKNVFGRIKERAQKAPRRSAAAGAAMLAVLVLCSYGAIRATRSASATPAPPLQTAALVANNPPPPATAATKDEEDNAVLMDLPPNATNSHDKGSSSNPARTGTRGAKPGVPHRPKFLNTRE